MSAVILQNSRTGLFYRGFNRWVMHAEDAFDFHDPRRAIEWIHMVNLGGVDVVEKEILMDSIASKSNAHAE